MQEKNESLRDINLRLKGSARPAPNRPIVGSGPEPARKSSGPLLIRAKFFSVEEGEFKELIHALLYTIPSEGDVFELGEELYQVLRIRRVLQLTPGDNMKAREAFIRVFVTKYLGGRI